VNRSWWQRAVRSEVVDPHEVMIGMVKEMVFTSDERVAKALVEANLREDPRHYSKLAALNLAPPAPSSELNDAIDEAAEEVRPMMTPEELKEFNEEVVPALHASVDRLITEAVKSFAVVRPDLHEALAKFRPKLFKRQEDRDDDEEEDDEEVHEMFRPYRPDGPLQEQAQVSIGGAVPATSPEEDMPDARDRYRTGDNFSFPTTAASLPAWRRRRPRIV
jgi:hypothetical protein